LKKKTQTEADKQMEKNNQHLSNFAGGHWIDLTVFSMENSFSQIHCLM